MNQASVTELKQGGLAALTALLLLPGVLWIAGAKGGKSIAVRSLVVAGLVGSALAIELAMEKTAAEIEDVLA